MPVFTKPLVVAGKILGVAYWHAQCGETLQGGGEPLEGVFIQQLVSPQKMLQRHWKDKELSSVVTRHGVIVISNRNHGHDYDYDCELVIVIDYIHGKYNVIAIVIDYFTKVIEIMITYHDYMIFCITVTYIL